MRAKLVFRGGAFVPCVWRFAGLDLTGRQLRGSVETPDGARHAITFDLLSANPTESFVRMSMAPRVYASLPRRLRVATCPCDVALITPGSEPVPLARGYVRVERY